MKISIQMEIKYTQAFTILYEQYKLLYIQIFNLFFSKRNSAKFIIFTFFLKAYFLLLMSHRESPVESPAEALASAGDLTGEDVQRPLNMFLGSLTPQK